MPVPVDGFSVLVAPLNPTQRKPEAPTLLPPSLPPAPLQDSSSIGNLEQKVRANQANKNMVCKSWEAVPEQAGPDWELNSGLKEGRRTLENGNVQVVSIDGKNMEIREFEGDRLVKSVKGALSDGLIVLDTEFYDESGEVSQSIHTELVSGQSDGGWTLATRSRNIEWFEDGHLTRKMDDEMHLQTKNMFPSLADGSNSFASYIAESTRAQSIGESYPPQVLTQEMHMSRYFASIQGYGTDGRLVRDMTIVHKGQYEQQTNRYNEKSNNNFGIVQGMEHRQSMETSHKTDLSVHVKEYDEDGELISDAQFTDMQKDGRGEDDGRERQTLSVDFYNNGELVRRSQGSFSTAESATAKLAGRPGIIEMLALEEESYVSDEPQSAMELMASNILESGSDPDSSLAGIQAHITGEDYGTVEFLAGPKGERKADREYDLDWTDELYRDGVLLMRQSDRESAEKAYKRDPFARGIHFDAGGGLTGGDNPVYLRKSSHERENYDEDSRMVSRQATRVSEDYTEHADGTGTLATRGAYSQREGTVASTEAFSVQGPMESMDTDMHAAARDMGNTVKHTLKGLYQVFSSLNGQEGVRTTDGQILRVDFTDN